MTPHNAEKSLPCSLSSKRTRLCSSEVEDTGVLRRGERPVGKSWRKVCQPRKGGDLEWYEGALGWTCRQGESASPNCGGGMAMRGGEGRRQRPLLRVSATKLRVSASWESARKLDILTVTKREAEPPIPIALTVLEMVQ